VATPTKLYPVKGHYLNDFPAAVQVVETKAEAEALVATGAFTDNPRHPDRDHEAPDSTKPEAPADAGVPDSTEE
jgi:hypothetical protein